MRRNLERNIRLRSLAEAPGASGLSCLAEPSNAPQADTERPFIAPVSRKPYAVKLES